MPCLALPIPPRVSPPPVCDLTRELNADIVDVREGRVQKIARPGRWVVWRVEGQPKPRMRVFG